MKHCFWCGEEVGNEDWDYVGGQRLWCCGKSECEREARAEHRASYEDEAERLYDDYFGR